MNGFQWCSLIPLASRFIPVEIQIIFNNGLLTKYCYSHSEHQNSLYFLLREFRIQTWAQKNWFSIPNFMCCSNFSYENLDPGNSVFNIQTDRRVFIILFTCALGFVLIMWRKIHCSSFLGTKQMTQEGAVTGNIYTHAKEDNFKFLKGGMV